jgi:hypothetical protein
MRALFEAIASLFSVFRRGGPQGNMPSPRYLVDIDIPAPYRKTTVQNTNSMEPLIDIGHTVILKKPEGKPLVGDIIIWERGYKSVIHSIIETGVDNDGWYCRTQGLNIYRPDPEKIRLNEVKWFVVGVLWTYGEGYYKAKEGD